MSFTVVVVVVRAEGWGGRELTGFSWRVAATLKHPLITTVTFGPTVVFSVFLPF